MQWLFAPGGELSHNTSYPAFVAIEVCTNARCEGGAGSGGGWFPNGTGRAEVSTATKFRVMDQGEEFARLLAPFQYDGLAASHSSARVGTATVSAAGGSPLEMGVEYWARVYAGMGRTLCREVRAQASVGAVVQDVTASCAFRVHRDACVAGDSHTHNNVELMGRCR